MYYLGKCFGYFKCFDILTFFNAPSHYLSKCWLDIIGIHPRAISQKMHEIGKTFFMHLSGGDELKSISYVFLLKLNGIACVQDIYSLNSLRLGDAYIFSMPLQWHHNDHDGVSNHQPHGCLLNRLFRRRSKKTSKLRVTGLCVGNSPGPVNSPHKWPVTRKMFPFDDVIMARLHRYLPLGRCHDAHKLKCLTQIWRHRHVDKLRQSSDSSIVAVTTFRSL